MVAGLWVRIPRLLVKASANVRVSAGKSSLTVRFVERHFVESYYPTIENTFSRIIKHNGEDFATEIVDTAGQVRPSSWILGRANCNRMNIAF